ncbi:MAG: tRNA (N6-isopentenyl adenosine(37)-C2)-methylthiotransferase MiaB [Bacteroidetes bacterium]|nr:tRNA (N6-isopentenyl adenosine(37)-C2)-methylthiotransferase MiaB [Bacteroidota bacterium]
MEPQNIFKKKFFIETYGCQMNFSDSEIVASILTENSYQSTDNYKDADFIFINTCSIRDNAEQRVRNRLQEYKSQKKRNPTVKIGVLGCMAERLKEKLLEEENFIDLIIGPDAYRDLPLLIADLEPGQKGINVLLSNEETYSDINPVRLNSNGINAFISIMRGCENFCTYCVVPFTRGKERSRNPESIINEAKDLFEKGFREVTLLGQNVNSYAWNEGETIFNFSILIEKIAQIDPKLRVRYATSHPKDMSDELLHIIAKYNNLCKTIHLPVQSGSSNILKKMNRKYTREDYLNRIKSIRNILPNCAISTDIISGFCGETEEDHQETISLMKEVGFDYAFMFKYSERPDTLAAKKYPDDIPEEIKNKRLQEIIDLQQELSHQSNLKDLNKTTEVLVEGFSKRSKEHLTGRNSQNKVVIFPKENFQIGEYAIVLIKECSSATLKGITSH